MSFESNNTIDRTSRVFTVLLGAALTLYIFQVFRLFFICDDAYISYRYAEHFALGHGLVWNIGEPIEGYTNFLWVLFTGIGIWLGFSPISVSTAGSVLAGLLVLLTLLRAVPLITPSAQKVWHLLPTLLLISSVSFSAWSTSGLETMAFTAWITLGAFVLCRGLSEGRLPLAAAVLFAAAALTRPEGNLFAGLAGFLLLAHWLMKRVSFTRLLLWSGVYVAIVGAHVLWRYSYYGYFVPNTFVAKVPGLWFEQGLNYFALFFQTYPVAWAAALLPVLLFRRQPALIVLSVLYCAAYTLYVLSIGGDRFEFRFLVPIAPFAALLITQALLSLPQLLRVRLATPLSGALAVALIGCTSFSNFYSPPKKERHGIVSLKRMERYAEGRALQGKFIRDAIARGELPEEVTLAVGGAGALPFYAGWKTIDRRGLNDLTVARMPIAKRGIIAHERDATPEYFRERQVEIFDFENRLVFERDKKFELKNPPKWHGEELRLRGLKIADRFLIFATFVEDTALLAKFGEERLIIPEFYTPSQFSESEEST